MKKLLLILILVLLGVQTASGYTWWQDHFISDNSASFGDDGAQTTWNTGLGTGWLNYTAAGGTFQYYYKDEKFGSGDYSWHVNYNGDGSSHVSYLVYGSQTVVQGDPQATGKKYALLVYGSTDLYLRYVHDGAYDGVASASVAIPRDSIINVTWDSDTGSHKIYLNGVLQIDTSNSGITTPGYMGIANYATQETPWSTDWWEYGNSTAPVTPTPTPTPAPISVCNIRNMNITVKKGETWIKWNWSLQENITQFIIDDQDIYLNGSLWKQNYTHTYFNLPNVGSNSYQVLEVWQKNFTYDNITQCMYSAVRSDPAYVWWYLIIGLGLLCIGYFVPLFGFLAIIILLLGFYMVYQEYTQSYIVLTYALSAIVAMIVTAARFGRKR